MRISGGGRIWGVRGSNLSVARLLRGLQRTTFDRSGLWINAAKGGYIVTYAAAGSPAAEAGLHAGDVILGIDGQPARAEGLSNARELLRARPAGTRVPMLVKGKSGTRRIVLTLRDRI
jgi:C-terminal processing protease CtpA/Prc